MNALTKQTSEEMERLLARLLAATLATLGGGWGNFPRPYDQWVATSAHLLDEVLEPNASGGADNLAEAWAAWRAARADRFDTPDLRAQAQLAEACLVALPDVLTGRRPARDVLFPEGSTALVDGVHHGNPIVDQFNNVLGDMLARYVAARVAADAGARLRILEVGGGVGATTGRLLDRLDTYRDNIAEYRFTDISQVFLGRAEERFGQAAPFFATSRFDIEAPAAAQGIALDGYDVLVAANVLHVASDIRAALRNLKTALHRGGLLMVNELSARSLFTHLTFGLLEEWWKHVDPAVREPGSPVIRPETMDHLLRAEGFPEVLFPAEASHHLGQQIVIAESDGIVRERPRAEAPRLPDAQESRSRPRKTETRASGGGSAGALDRSAVAARIHAEVARVLEVPAAELDPAKPLARYGLDSILAIRLAKALSADFDGVRTTLFFEAETVDALAEALEGQIREADRRPAATSNSAPGSTRAPTPDPTSDPTPDTARPAPAAMAVIGLAGRFPGAPDTESLWENLLEGRDAITVMPDARRALLGLGHEPADGRGPWGGYLEGVELFDPLFFDISPREAEMMPPEERLFLETVWTLLEGAGHAGPVIAERYDNRVGVFVGAMYQHYREAAPDLSRRALASIASFSGIANRVSHALDFTGPSIAVDTMCSASAIGIHLACESLRNGDCSLAVAGGVNLSLHPSKFDGLDQAGLIAQDADSRSFARGTGYLPAEVVGAVLLKPLDRALADGDEVLAVIKASAVNHTGRTAGSAVPSLKAERRLIEENFHRAGIDPATIGYVEVAANGSALGDSIEVEALSGAFGAHDGCVIGSVKSNIGHPEAASGIAQLAKVIMQLRHRRLVPTIKAWPLNEEIRLDDSPFRLIHEPEDWRPMVDGAQRPLPLRASLHSFGGGGSNAHLILEEAPAAVHANGPRGGEDKGPQWLLLSARTPTALRAMADRLAAYLVRRPALGLEDVAYTLRRGRMAFEYRLAVRAETREAACRALRAEVSGQADEARTGERFLVLRGRVDLDAPPPATPTPPSPERAAEPDEVARCWIAGCRVDWPERQAAAGDRPVDRIISLPTYPFERERCWFAPASPQPASAPRDHEVQIDADDPVVRDHGGALPAAAHILLIRRALEAAGNPAADLCNIVWVRPAVSTAGGLALRIRVSEGASGAGFEVLDADGALLAKGRALSGAGEREWSPIDPEALGGRLPHRLGRADCDRLLEGAIGPSLFTLVDLSHDGTEALARVERTAPAIPSAAFGDGFAAGDLAMLNGVMLAAAVWGRAREPGSALAMPFTVKRLHLKGRALPARFFVRLRMAAAEQTLAIDLTLHDAEGAVLGALDGLALRPIGQAHQTMPTLEGTAPIDSALDAAGSALIPELRDMLATIQRMPAERIATTAPWSRFGLSSLGFTEFATCINSRFDLDVMPTIFFEHLDLRALGAHLALLLEDTAGDGARRASRLADRVDAPRTRRAGEGDVSAASVAIVGMAARLPGADDPDQLWEHLANERDLIGDVPADRWNWRDLAGDPHREPGRTRAKWGGFLGDIDRFDAGFFGLSRAEAELMDPQSRLVLEAAWTAVEDAGIAPSSLSGKPIGVFVGVSTADYKDLCQAVDPTLAAQVKPFMIANRVSHVLDLTGPSEVIDTACSSSLVAIHRAVDAIRRGACEAALVGGVNVIAAPEITLSLSRAGVLSEDGRCMAFDDRANGMVRGEGVGMLLLKPLRDARADADRILGVVRGSAENHDGRSSSASAPNPAAQRDLIRAALKDAGVGADSIGYVEAHGTGTELGDPVEIKGLRGAFEAALEEAGAPPVDRPFCAVGSVKTTIGHLEAAAGVAGVVKVLMMFRHGRIPGNIHLRRPNPYLELAGGPLRLVRSGEDWPRPTDQDGSSRPRRAGVSSFGIGGSNAHVILEEYSWTPADAAVPVAAMGPFSIPLSAPDEAGLRRQVATLAAHLDRVESAMDALAFTLQTGRDAMACRLGIVADDLTALRSALGDLAERAGPLAGVLIDAAAGQNASQNAVEGGSSALAHWVAGGATNWHDLWGPTTPRRIALPPYPFARERYWLPTPDRAPNPAGTICIPESPEKKDGEVGPYLAFKPAWRPVPTSQADSGADQDRLTFLCGAGLPDVVDETAAETLRAGANAEDPADRFEALAAAAFERLRDILDARPKAPLLVQIVVADGPDRALVALSGMLATATKENARVSGQLLLVEPDLDAQTLRRHIATAALTPDVGLIRVNDGAPARLAWEELEPPQSPAGAPPWRDNGVYLITGGTGGLGLVFAREIAACAARPTIVLAGRSRANADTFARIAELEALGAMVVYRQADVTRQDAVDALATGIARDHGPLNGVLHCAGINRARHIIRKPTAEFRAVLAPKVSGTVALDRATASMPLDLFVLFASGAGVIGAAGQADYACANGFLDAFADARAERVVRGERQGRTIAIDWPLWRDGGMRLSGEDAARTRAETGMVAMDAATGLDAFYRALDSGLARVGVVAGSPDSIRAALDTGPAGEKADRAAARSVGSADPEAFGADDRLLEATFGCLAALIAEQVKMTADAVLAEEPFDTYGIDSIAVIALNERLERVFGPISRTLFFEVRTGAELAAYFVAEYPEECRRWTGLAEGATGEAQSASAPARISTAPVVRSAAPQSGPQAQRGAAAGTIVDDPVAVVGLSGRLPEAETLEAFWENLKAGRDCVTELPEDRWPQDGFFEADPDRAIAEGKSFARAGGFLKDATSFDPLFFKIAPREAMAMDPQERLMLETAWAAVEDAGYSPEALKREAGGRVGVFIGITKTGFDLYAPDLWRKGEASYPHTSFGSIANRVSYCLDLSGPSMTVDTLCSSSLTALHAARTHILAGDCEMAIVGAVNLYLHPANFTSLCAQGFMASGGRCRAFGAEGDGFAPGEGVGAVVLKRLSRAQADGDHIHALIRGTASNHDGHTNGYTVPSPTAQAALVRAALESAGLEARALSYIEAHGTGTELGDPIEIAGLTQALEGDRDAETGTPPAGSIAIGSVKSNIGHLEAAAGMAGLFKIILQIRHGQLVPSLHAEPANPNIDFARTPFTVQRTLADWPRPIVAGPDGGRTEGARVAGLSSFGAGGSNAHAIIEEYREPADDPRDAQVGPELIVLSAPDAERLIRIAERLLERLRDDPPPLGDLAATLRLGRQAMEERLAFTADTIDAVVDGLERLVAGALPRGVAHRGRARNDGGPLARLVGAAEAERLLAEWFADARLDRLAEVWVGGARVDWSRLARPERLRRVPLPTYPFRRERYWFDVAPTLPSQRQAGTVTVASPSPEGGASSGPMTFAEDWVAAPALADGPLERVLVWAPSREEASALAEALQMRGARSVCAISGAPDAQGAAIGDFVTKAGGIDQVVYVGRGTADDAPAIAALLRALDGAQGMPGMLLLAGRSDTPLAAAHIQSWIGFERSLRLIRPDLRVATVIGDPAQAEADWRRALAAELAGGAAGAVRHRDDRRERLMVRPWSLPASPVAVPPPPGGAILITGGAGGLGLALAEHLAARGPGAPLVLLGRSRLDASQTKRLAALEATGTPVLHLQADIGSPDALNSALTTARARFGPIVEAYHLAGVQAAGDVFSNDRAAFQSVCAAKVDGLLGLDRALADDPVRVLCVFSSIAAVLGDFGSCDYAVANRFQMAYADARAADRAGAPIIAVAWPLWRDGGMGRGAADATALYLQASGQRLLERAEAFAVLDGLVAALPEGGGGRIVVAGDRAASLRILGIAEDAAEDAAAEPAGTGGSADLEGQVAAALRRVAGALLEIPPDRFEDNRNFADFGFDSVSLGAFAKALTADLGIEVTPSTFYGQPTFDKLTAHLLAGHTTALRARFAAEGRPAPVSPQKRVQKLVQKSVQAPIRTSGARSSAEADPAPVASGRVEPIAIIGMAGRFPGADDCATFWRRVQARESAIGPIPEARRDTASTGPATNRERGGFLESIDRFDPLFFEIPPSEAAAMDPRQRLFLEVAWEALEEAALVGDGIAGARCGVFVGVEEGLAGSPGDGGAINSAQNATLPARIAYFLDLDGPNLAITSACSSALVAVHQASSALRSGECDTAIAGGVNVMLATAGFEGLRRAGMLSTDGEARVFDARASGLVPGEAVAAVVLKPLTAARRDGDPIHGVITDSLVNHGGRSNGITAPNPTRQAALVRRLHERAGVAPNELQFLMAHAVGSPNGDAIEIDALTQAFATAADARDFCAVGSVKPLVGHCFAASGLVGLIASVQAMKHSEIPALPLDGVLNPGIAEERTPFRFPRSPAAWPRPAGQPRRAAVGATGISGTNAYVLIEEAPAMGAASESAGPWIVPISARTPDRLRALAARLADHLAHVQPRPRLVDVAWTLTVGRRAMKHRLAVVADTLEDVTTRLAAFSRGEEGTIDGRACVVGKAAPRPDSVMNAQGLCGPVDRAAAWCVGAPVTLVDAFDTAGARKLHLPAYPFEPREMGAPAPTPERDEPEPSDTVGVQSEPACLACASAAEEPTADGEATVVALYRTIAEMERPEFKEGFLTFFPLAEKRPGFSITRVGLDPARYPDDVALIHDKQRESRRVLMAGIDFSGVRRVLDFGCGYGRDIVDLATRHPHLKADGYTITPAQAEAAEKRITRSGLAGRAAVYNRDSTRDRFPDRYDLALGIEVCCHIEDKDGLFENLRQAMAADGRVLLMDFVACLRGAIIDPRVSVYIPTAEQWVELITRSGFEIERTVDLSPEIANAMHDPDCAENTKDLPPVLRDSWRNWTNNAVAIEKGWVEYRFLILKPAARDDTATLGAANRRRFNTPQSYREALAAADAMPGSQAPNPHETPPIETPSLEPGRIGLGAASAEAIRPALEAIFCETLQLSNADLADVDTIAELGLASLNALSLLEAINQRFDLNLPTSVIFQVPTLSALADYIAERHAQPAKPAKLETAGVSANAGRVAAEAPGRPIAPDAGAPIAVIGMACRSAGADDEDALWRLISEGREAIAEIQTPAWLDYFQRHSDRPMPLRYGAIGRIDSFDTLFFQISPNEADAMSVPQRLLLEETYHALEAAAIAPHALKRAAVGTYIGVGAGMGPEVPDHSHLSMLGSDTSISAARIAFLLDLAGPAIAVNTACSSSLVAIDLAIKDLRAGTVDQAIAGGVTVWDHPAPFVSMNNAGMLSPTGRCRPFDNAADGIVVGDGVGVVILKRLADAERDGDPIRAVILESGTNQDGLTTGITVPSFGAQSSLQSAVYERAGIDPRHIQYVEAHGTATKLGDPVEIHALTDSFARSTDRRVDCAIGSLKANIGHTAAAAGVMGLIKTVRALEARTLPPSINFTHANEHIDFAASPFRVNTQSTPWPVNEAGGRLAVVSSFGYSGTNAHLALTGYAGAAGAEVTPPDDTPHLIVLSGRDADRLRAVAGTLAEHLEQFGRDSADEAGTGRNAPDLAAIAYTLQVGRDALDCRAAFVACDLPGLCARLRHLADDREDAAIHRTGSQAPAAGLPGSVPLDATDMAGLVDRWLVDGQFDKLAAAWVAGTRIEWARLYPTPPRRLRLPGYPFAARPARLPTVGAAYFTEPALHPLLHRNGSDLSGVRFESRFTGREPFLADHRVDGLPLLPGVAALEMATAALRLAGAAADMTVGRVTWVRPIRVGDAPVTVITDLMPEGQDRIRIEIGCRDADGRMEICTQAIATRGGVPVPIPDIDLERATADTQTRSLDTDQCYAVFADAGVDYGPSHRLVAAVRGGDGCALARLNAPTGDAGADYALPPGLLDGALQATVALMAPGAVKYPGDVAAPRPMLPFALDRLRVMGPLHGPHWAWIRPCDGPAPAGGALRLDIDLCDDAGRVAVRLEGLSARTLSETATPRPVPETSPADSTDNPVVIRVPRWAPTAKPASPPSSAPAHRVLLTVGLPALAQAAEGRSTVVRLSGAAEGSGDWDGDAFQALAVETLEYLRGRLAGGTAADTLLQIALPAGERASCAAAGLGGLVKTALLERPGLRAQVVELDADRPVESLLDDLEACAAHESSSHLRCREGVPLTEVWGAAGVPAKVDPAWRDGGVYLISGGAGGLGMIFARAIAAAAADVRLVLIGRSPRDAVAERIATLEAAGAGVEYHALDVADAYAVSTLARQVIARHGRIDGVLHAAGVLRDGILLKKTPQDLRAVLAPKVMGALALDAATADFALDHFILFSSGAGAWGNPGQADYAAANAFLDAFAVWRDGERAAGRRRGRSLSINWPLWRAGGMTVDDAVRARMTATIGAVPLETGAGLAALDRLLAAGLTRAAVMQGDPDRLAAAGFGDRSQETGTEPVEASARVASSTSGAEAALDGDAGETAMDRAIRAHLTACLCAVLGVAPTELDPAKEFSAFGLDSVMVLDVNNRLEADFPDLPQTLFFEHATLDELCGYFLVHQRDGVRALVTSVAEPISVPAATPAVEKARDEAVADGQPPVGGAFDLDAMIAGLEEIAQPSGASSPSSEILRHSPFHSVAPLRAPIEGYTFSEGLLAPENLPRAMREVVLRQAELRRVLLGDVELERMRRAVDLGCGIGADAIALASANPALAVDALTISPGDAETARSLIAARDLTARVRVIEEDSRLHAFAPGLDLALSIQTLHFVREIEEKRALFARLFDAMDRDGVLAMADYVGRLQEPMGDPVLGSTIHGADAWGTALAHAGFVLERVIDASAEVAAFLRDEDLESHLAAAKSDQAGAIRKLVRQGDSLDKGWIAFLLMRARKATDLSEADRTDRNRRMLTEPISYSAAVDDKARCNAYRDPLVLFPEFLSGLGGAQ